MPGADLHIALLLGTANSGAADAGVRWAHAMFFVIAGLLIAFLTTVAIVVVARNMARRAARRRGGSGPPLADPWKESARRIKS